MLTLKIAGYICSVRCAKWSHNDSESAKPRKLEQVGVSDFYNITRTFKILFMPYYVQYSICSRI